MLNELLLVVIPKMFVVGVYGEIRLSQSLVGMNDPDVEFWHVEFVTLVELSLLLGFLQEEPFALSDSSVLILWFCGQ